MMGYGYGPGGFGTGAFIGMMLFGLLVLVAIVLLIVWAVRASSHHAGYGQGGGHPAQTQPHGAQWQPVPPGMVMPPPGQGGAGGGQGVQGRDPAVDAARERYARGEITKEQLDEIMRNLGYQG